MSSDGKVESVTNDFSALPVTEQEARFRLAAKEGDLDVLRYFMNLQNFNINAIEPELGVLPFTQYTALKLACTHGQTDVVHILLADPRIDARYDDNFAFCQNPLNSAVTGGHSEIVHALLERSQKVSIQYDRHTVERAFWEACENGHLDIAKELLDRYSDLNVNACPFLKDSPVVTATENGHTDIVRWLLGFNSTDVNYSPETSRNITALHEACSKGRTEIVKMLFESGKVLDCSSLNYKKESALNLAAINGHTDAINLMLEYPPVRNDLEDIQTALISAAKNDHIDVFCSLVEVHGVDINHTTDNGDTLLHIAHNWEMSKKYDVVKFLLNYDSFDVNKFDGKGSSALHAIVEEGNIDCTILMLDCPRVNVNICDADLHTSILLAAQAYRKRTPTVFHDSYGGTCSEAEFADETSLAQVALQHEAHRQKEEDRDVRIARVIELLLACSRVDVNIYGRGAAERMNDSELRAKIVREIRRRAMRILRVAWKRGLPDDVSGAILKYL
eukprot:1003947_1